LGIKEGEWRQLTDEEQRKVIQPSR
jgi:hypothetical protein